MAAVLWNRSVAGRFSGRSDDRKWPTVLVRGHADKLIFDDAWIRSAKVGLRRPNGKGRSRQKRLFAGVSFIAAERATVDHPCGTSAEFTA